MLHELTSITEQFNEEVANGMDSYQAECRVIKAISEIGRSMILNWVEKTQTQAVNEITKGTNVVKHGKKNSAELYWYCTLAKIVLQTQVVRHKPEANTSLPFFKKAKLKHSNSSLLLEKRVVDFSPERGIKKTAKAII